MNLRSEQDNKIYATDVLSYTVGMNNDNLETFFLLWLDGSANATSEYIEAQRNLRLSINCLKIFEDDHQCETYIRSLSSQDRVVLIVSSQFSQSIVPRIHSLRQLSGIYVYCLDKFDHIKWSKNFIKVSKINC